MTTGEGGEYGMKAKPIPSVIPSVQIFKHA
jgi:hypothetical protein